MKTIKSTFLLVLAFLVLALPSTYSFSATTSYENVLSKPFQSTANLWNPRGSQVGFGKIFS